MTYMVFTSTIVVPAMTEYQVTFSYDLTLTRKVSDTSSSISSATEFFHFGDTNHSDLVSYHFNSASAGGYVLEYIRDAQTGAKTRNTNAKGSLSAITYTNTTNAPKTYTEYFGITCTGGRGTNFTGGTTVTLKMSDQVKITALNAPTVDRTQADYSANGNVFNFTYDSTRVDYTVSYKDVTDTVSDVTSTCTINTDGKCTLKDAGTYTFTFKIKDNCGAVWNSTTNDQTYKTLTITITSTMLPVPSGRVETTYNGETQSLGTLTSPPSWYVPDIYGNPDIIATDGAFTDAGEHEVTVTLRDGGYFWSDYATNQTNARTYTFCIVKKPLAVTFEENKDSGLLEATYDESQLYDRDKTGDKKPVLITKYSKTGSLSDALDAPDGLGKWYAIAVLENADSCNYTVNADEQFEASKTKLAYPKLSTVSNPSQAYTNADKIFEFTGYDSELMSFTVPDGAVSFDGTTLIAKDAGTYTIVYTLKDTSLYEWSGATDLKVTITPRALAILADDNPTEWGSGTVIQLNFLAAPLSGDSVQLAATFQRDGSEPTAIAVLNNGDGTHSVTIPASWGMGAYTLAVKVADGENYTSEGVTVSFTIKAEGLSLEESDIRWLVSNKPQSIELDEDGYLVLEYTGAEITFEADIRALVDFKISEYGGDTSATDIGEYSVSVRIVAADSTLYDFDKTFTLKYRIVQKTLNFSDAVWQWQYDGDSEWETMTSSNMPPYDGRTVNVRISPEYFSGLGLAEIDYSVEYQHANDLTEKGEKTTKAIITIANENFVTADGSSSEVTKEWIITARALKYQWNATQTITAGDTSFEFAAITFDEAGDYSQYFEYYYTVDGQTGEFSKEQLEAYLAENWSETTPVTGRIYVRMTGVSEDFVIREGYRSFSTGASKTALAVTVTVNENAVYGDTGFDFTVKRGEADERVKTVLTVAGQTFNGNDTTAIAQFINTLDVGEYTVTVSLTEENQNAYMLTGDYTYTFTINKFVITDEMWGKDGTVNLPAQFSGIEIGYKYYSDESATAEVDISALEAGAKYYVIAALSGEKAGNFEFENGSIVDGTPTSAVKEFEKVKVSSIIDLIKDNLVLVLIIVAVFLLLLIILTLLWARRRRAAYDDEYDDYDEYDDEYDDYDEYDDDEDDYY